ncbi:multisubunit sodium/proton antiporter, MrpB subunit [Rhodovulum sp. ES.010]|uniref:hydrogen gas-evolving membrane-bound hydrogenase subunit E n=1 Tax=Rhodovulum sp. ES.010 TaxID=1882821 RepID=UPI000927FD92|nr:hydrogen gas-evolving membrane-bound hydrogenase subunit E [Rhodovulum sp. ES.010]SIO54701.1 multisubunit sodium/proton antiporter, MrpB subunit [Rhodovulum sp. ES.010]
MTGLFLAFDLMLATAIVGLAAATLLVRDAFAMIVAFVVFGMLVALAWARLVAPDVALAEAAIGAGITGAILLRTLAHLRGGALSAKADAPVAAAAHRPTLGMNAVLAGLATAALGLAFLGAPQGGAGLEAQVAAAMPESGVSHPVTAVLLNFRAYDTLMEVVVLLSAVIVVWQVERGLADAPVPALGDVYQGFARVALPVAVIAGGYLLWIGAEVPGGAFQAGAVLAAVAVLALLSRQYRPVPGHRPLARGAFVAGTAVFAVVALGIAGAGRAAFEYPPAHAKTLILLIEAMVTISIAATLAALFHGREPVAVAQVESKR